MENAIQLCSPLLLAVLSAGVLMVALMPERKK
jgi:hypothetical protein